MPDPISPQPVPINAKCDDDFVTQLVVVLETDSMREVAAKVAQHVVGKRQPARDADLVVRYQGRSLPPDITVAEAGIAPLQNVYIGLRGFLKEISKSSFSPVRLTSGSSTP